MIGIIAAMRAEVDALLNLMEETKEKEIFGLPFWEGKLGKRQVVLMMSGVGKGNAAMATSILLLEYHLNYVINIGTAGGLCSQQQVLDLVISERIVQHDYDTSALDGLSGVGLYYDADAHLVELCEKLFTERLETYHKGLVASGDQFISEETQLRQLLQKFPKAICAEMEAGAIAQVCTHFQVPFVILRSLSDIAFQAKSHLDFCEYVHMASHRSASLCEALVENL